MRYSRGTLTFEGNAGPHPHEDEIEEFVFGRLRGTDLDDFEEHLLVCELCRRRLTETETFVASTRAATRKILGAPPPTPKPRRFSPPALALAGAMAVALLTASFFILPKFREAQPVDLTAERGVTRIEARAGNPLNLRLAVGDLGESAPPVRWLEIVNAQGARMHSAAVSAAKGYVLHGAPPLPQGQAWIRLYSQHSPSPESPPLREYSRRVQ